MPSTEHSRPAICASLRRWRPHAWAALAAVVALACGGQSTATPAAATPAAASAPKTGLDAEIEVIRARYGVPALTGMSFRSSGIVERGAAGVRAQGYGESVTVNDRWHLGSLTKAMTATLAAMLIEERRLSWETTVSDVFPDLAPRFRPEYATVRLEELLTHTAGLTTEMWAVPSWPALQGSSEPLRGQRRRLVAEYLALPPASARGTYSYSNAGYVVAGAMLEEITAEPWEELMSRLLYARLGMSTAGFGSPGTAGQPDQPWGHVASGASWRPLAPGPAADNPAAVGPAGTAHGALTDLFAFYRLHLAGELGVGGQLLTPASLERLHRAAAGTSYACGWQLSQREWARGRVLLHSGSNTYWLATVFLAPQRDLGLFVATNVGSDPGARANDEVAALLTRRFDAAFP